MPAKGKVKKLTPKEKAQVRRELARRKREAKAPAAIAPGLAAATKKPSKAEVKKAEQQIDVERRKAMTIKSGREVLEREQKKKGTPMAIMGIPARLEVRKTLRNIPREAKEIASTAGPGLVELVKAPVMDIKAAGASFGSVPSGTRKGGSKADYSFKHSRKAGKGLVEEGKYLLDPVGPVILRYNEQGKPIYRDKTGGETLERKNAETGIVNKFEERPITYSAGGRTAGLAVGRAFARGGTKLGKSLEKPGTIHLTTRKGEKVKQRTSSNPVRRKEQEAVRKATVAVGSAIDRVAGRETAVGPHARAVRKIDKRKRREERADKARATREFDEANRDINGREQVAVVLHAVGESPSSMRKFAEQRIAEVRTDLEKARQSGDRKTGRKLRAEIRRHERNIRLFDKVGDDLYDSVPKDARLSRARAAAADLDQKTGDILEATDQLTPETRALRPYLTKRIVGGARYQYPHVTQTRMRAVAQAQRALTTQAKAVKRKVTKAVKAGPQTEAFTLAKQQEDVAFKATQAQRRERTAARDEVQRRDRQLKRAEESLVFAQVRAAEGGSKLPVLERARQVQETKMALDEAKTTLKRSIREGTEHTKAYKAASERRKLAEEDARVVQQQGLAKHAESLGAIGRERARRGEEAAQIQDEAGGFSGGPEIEGLRAAHHDLINFPHTGPRLRTSDGTQRSAGAAPPQKLGMSKQNKGVRLLTARWLPAPSAWRDNFIRAIGYTHARARGEIAVRLAEPLNPETGGADPGWHYVRLDGTHRPTRAAKEEGLLDAQFDDFVNGSNDMDGWLRENVVGDANDAARWADEDPDARIGQISDADYKQLFGEYQRSSAFVRRVMDKPTDFWRALTLNYRPAWMVNNIVGQNLLWAINNFGPGGVKAYAQAVMDAKNDTGYFPEELRQAGIYATEQRQAGGRADSAVGGVAAGRGFKQPFSRETLPAIRDAERQARGAIGKVNTALSDNPPRRAAWLRVTQQERKLYNRLNKTSLSRAEFHKALEDSKKPGGDRKMSQLHDDIVEQVLDELIDFSNLSKFERNFIRRAIPFYSWIKGSTMASVKLYLNKPSRVVALSLIGNQGETERELKLGEAAGILKSVAPVGKAVKTARGIEQNVFGTAGMSPWQTTADVVGMAESLWSGEGDSRDNPALSMAPQLQTGMEALTHRDIFTGKEVKGGIVEAFARGIATSFPQTTTIQAGVFPKSKTKDSGDAKVSVPGVKYLGIPSEFWRYGGVPLSRKNVTAAKAVAEIRKDEKRTREERAYRSIFKTRKEFYLAAKKHNLLSEDGKLGPKTRTAFNVEAERQGLYARMVGDTPEGTREYHWAKFRADIGFLVKYDAYNSATAKVMVDRFKGASKDELIDARRAISDKYYRREGGQLYYINGARKALEAAGAEL